MRDRIVVSDEHKEAFFKRCGELRAEGASVEDLSAFFPISKNTLSGKIQGFDTILESDYDCMMGIKEDDYSSFKYCNTEQLREFREICTNLFKLGISKRALARELGLCENYFHLKREAPAHVHRETYYRLKRLSNSDISICYTYLSAENEK